jgi:hypothetical protein
MRAPPPVEYPSALGRAWRTLLSLLVGASLASLVAWILPYVAAHWGSRQPDPLLGALADPVVEAQLALAAAAVIAACAWLAWKSAAASELTLRWDGQDWVLAGDPDDRLDQRGDVALMLDLGPWMLVRFLPYAASGAGFGAGAWLPLTLAGDLARWAALRGALWNWRGGRGDARP